MSRALRSAAAAVALAASSLLAACSPAGVLNATVPTGGVTIVRDVAYGDGPRRTLDIYRPADAAAAPVVVFIYGGSWRSGSKNDYLFVAAALARRGIMVAVPDYRLYPETRYPGFLRDCAQAVAWTQAHAATYGGNPHELFLMGHSAGAYNVMMLALDPEWLAAAGSRRDDLTGAIGLAGPYDFLPIHDPKLIPIFPGADNPATQPVSYADGHNPPLLLLAGQDDQTVYPRNTVSLAARVRAAGGAVSETIFAGIGHIGLVTAFAPLFRDRAPVLRATVDFIRDKTAKPLAAR
jgi:acetyl esterase/lipase